jgi:hypothetical protein
MLFVAGDNDTYPLWYAQEVLHVRRDVTMVTLPLLGAPWYDAEIRRRNPRLQVRTAADDPANLLAEAARQLGRPVAAALTLTAADRARVHGCWTVVGFALVDVTGSRLCTSPRTPPAIGMVMVDTTQTRRWVIQHATEFSQSAVRPAIDLTDDYFANLLECPRRMLALTPRNARGVSLDSTCNP